MLAAGFAAKAFAAVNQARLGEVEWVCIWIQVLQWKRDRARKVTLQPFGPARDIDELQTFLPPAHFASVCRSTLADRLSPVVA
jgi:hypothetical protein